MKHHQKGEGALIVLLIVIMLCLSVGSCMRWYPQYQVYSSKMDGEAELAKANYARQTQVAQAQAELDAAKLRAQAIAMVGKAAQDYPQYRQQEFIGAFADALRDGKIQQIMYVPTEAGIPITEAGRATEDITKSTDKK